MIKNIAVATFFIVMFATTQKSDTKQISSAVDDQGMKRKDLTKGSFIHEIIHNLGGDHSDKNSSAMSQVDGTTTNSQIKPSNSMGSNSQTPSFTYPSLSKNSTQAIFRKRNKAAENGASINTSKQ